MSSNTNVHDFAQVQSNPSLRRSCSTRVEEVLLISLDRQIDMKFDQDYAYLRRTLLSKLFSLNEITDPQSAAAYVSNAPIHLAAIIITDDSITRGVHEGPIIPRGMTNWLFHENGCLHGRWGMWSEIVPVEQYKKLTKELVKWARAGGTVIFGCRWGRTWHKNYFNTYIKELWGLGWETAGIADTLVSANYSLNENAYKRFWNSKYDGFEFCRMKSRLLTKVDSRDIIYPGYGGTASAVFAEYGNGYLGWLGDQGNEEKVARLIIAMCNL
jgi:hypothetical protein